MRRSIKVLSVSMLDTTEGARTSLSFLCVISGVSHERENSITDIGFPLQ
jgi:hypothetical protein